MLRRDRQMRMQIHQLMDACLFAVSFWLAYELRFDPTVIEWLKLPPPPAELESFFWFYLVLIPAGPLVLESQGFYDRPMISSRHATLWPLFKGCFIITVGLILAFFFLRLIVARSMIIWFGFISFALVFAKEEILRWVFQSELARAQYRRRFILVGTGFETTRMCRDLKARPDSGIEIVAELDLNNTPVEQLVQMLHDHAINGVILSARHAYFEQAEAIIRACEMEGVEAWLVADFFATQISRTTFDDFYGRPVMVFRSTPEAASWQSALKLVVDLFGALALLVVLSVPLAVVALLIKLTSPGPIMFRQLRSGLNGAPFTIYKFRTMVTNAEQLKHELATMNEMRGPVFKVTKDPRITRIGKILRRFSIDELPQLFNVLRGEMSLVGPRPLPVDEVRRFNDIAHRRRLSVKPGLTCLWQVSGRNQIAEFRDWVRLDLEYIDNWSLWLDFKILLRTVPAVLYGTGAK
jgi:exopolysaccharide biosynthesis polyprenyl glycosylphosphotransferase